MVDDLKRGGEPPSSDERNTNVDTDILSSDSGDTDTHIDTSADVTIDVDSRDGTGVDSDSVSDGSGHSDEDAEPDVVADDPVDTDSKADGDTDMNKEEPLEPTIFTIEGTGSIQDINPHPDDLSAWEAYAANRIEASRRIDSSEKRLVITGENLQGITTAVAMGQSNQGTIEFEIEETTMNDLTLKYPTVTAFGEDGTWNVDPAEYQGYTDNSLPAVGIRGGSWVTEVRAGLFALNLSNGPSYSANNLGARCCRQK